MLFVNFGCVAIFLALVMIHNMYHDFNKRPQKHIMNARIERQNQISGVYTKN